MDGAPVRGESIPIRLFLAGYDLTPTMRDINKKFSVRYYLNLVLVDEEERRYFKQQVRGHCGWRPVYFVLFNACCASFRILNCGDGVESLYCVCVFQNSVVFGLKAIESISYGSVGFL